MRIAVDLGRFFSYQAMNDYTDFFYGHPETSSWGVCQLLITTKLYLFPVEKKRKLFLFLVTCMNHKDLFSSFIKQIAIHLKFNLVNKIFKKSYLFIIFLKYIYVIALIMKVELCCYDFINAYLVPSFGARLEICVA